MQSVDTRPVRGSMRSVAALFTAYPVICSMFFVHSGRSQYLTGKPTYTGARAYFSTLLVYSG